MTIITYIYTALCNSQNNLYHLIYQSLEMEDSHFAGENLREAEEDIK